MTRPPSAVPEAAVGQPESAQAEAVARESSDESEERTSDTSEECGARSRLRSSAASPRSTTSTSAQIHGTGISGRVTKQDILGYIQLGEAEVPGRRRSCGDADQSSNQARRFTSCR